jgi:hypothetical protein
MLRNLLKARVARALFFQYDGERAVSLLYLLLSNFKMFGNYKKPEVISRFALSIWIVLLTSLKEMYNRDFRSDKQLHTHS